MQILVEIFEGRIFLKKLTRKQSIVIGFMLFSMFFGAGNLIFPPMLGMQAGTHTLSAMLGLIVTAVILPILGVAVVAKHGNLINLGSLVHPKFGYLFTILVCLIIGPIIAIPRTASTSFEMSVVPFVHMSDRGLLAIRILYSALFFVLAFIVALKPMRLKDLLGKIMTPILITMIILLFIAVVVRIPFIMHLPITTGYSKRPFLTGFSAGYQTMDGLAGLNFGLIIAVNIESYGIHDKNALAKETIKSGVIAGILLAALYMLLAYMGMQVNPQALSHMKNITGADILSYIVMLCFGKIGQAFVAVIFFIACFNVCCGLLSSVSEYFYALYDKISYKKWLVIFTVSSFFISILGLYNILSFSVYILNVLYPVAIGLMVLGFVRKKKDHEKC